MAPPALPFAESETGHSGPAGRTTQWLSIARPILLFFWRGQFAPPHLMPQLTRAPGRARMVHVNRCPGRRLPTTASRRDPPWKTCCLNPVFLLWIVTVIGATLDLAETLMARSLPARTGGEVVQEVMPLHGFAARAEPAPAASVASTARSMGIFLLVFDMIFPFNGRVAVSPRDSTAVLRTGPRTQAQAGVVA